MNIPTPTPRRRTNGASPPINLKVKKHALPNASQNANASQKNANEETQKTIKSSNRGVCPYCKVHVGRGISAHMKLCLLTLKSKTEST